MNTSQTIVQMQELKLAGMAASYRSQLELPIDQQLEGHELIAHLLQTEKLHRSNDRMETLLKSAKFRFNATAQDIECSAERNLSKATWSSLLEGNYLRAGENILITGSTGCGKSHVGCIAESDRATIGQHAGVGLPPGNCIETADAARTTKTIGEGAKVHPPIPNSFRDIRTTWPGGR